MRRGGALRNLGAGYLAGLDACFPDRNTARTGDSHGIRDAAFRHSLPHIDPVAIAVGPLAIRWYALSYVAGIVLGWWYSRRLAAKAALWGDVRRPEPDRHGRPDRLDRARDRARRPGRLCPVLQLASYLDRPAEIFTVWRGGMSFHGGFLGTILAIVLFARARGLHPLAMLDVAAVVTPIGLFTGRVANFVNGELWGRPAPDLPWAVVFPSGGDVPRHPSQLYEAFGEGLLLLLIMALAARRFGFRRPGLLGGIFVFGYAVARIVCEFFREPDAQLGFLLGGTTMGQLLSLPMAAVGLGVIILAARGWTRPRRTGAEAPA
jgi:phosphatidylglycerol:prolipoprotein diacylglycerol transferase